MDRSIFISGLVVLALIIAISSVNGNDLCPNTIVKLLPCRGFLMGKGDISVPCCNGVKGLMKMATSDDDLKLQNMCECLKKEALAIGVIQERAKQIPELCNINLSIPIDPNVDCKKLKTSSSTEEFKLKNYKNTGIMAFRRPNYNHHSYHSIPHKKPLIVN
ncbi:non-specific lipid-transfer protein 1-like [Lycium ferocissimum]|uniref:non-specific lipid-transfer protein 1-like n=1 Tax=Lycium ferocissimum TaxID=112874 RepID=UPI0028161DD1|nr:non-specific lipid-transfer protein 1-like [Lycium ferocissimum]